MARLTITLPDALHRALKKEAVRRRHTISGLIKESLEHYGVRDEETAASLLARARAHAALDEREALTLGIRETRAVRRLAT